MPHGFRGERRDPDNEASTIGETNKKEIRLNEFGVYQDAEIIVYRNRFYVLWKNNTNGQIWIGEVDMKRRIQENPYAR